MALPNAPLSRWRVRLLASFASVACAALTLPSPGWAQSAPPVVDKRVDLDGDGAPDSVRIDNPPSVSITFARSTDTPAPSIWKPFAAAAGTPVGGQITVGSGAKFAGKTIVVATVEFAGRQRRGPLRGRSARTGQAMILALSGTQVDKLWEGPIGAQGRDGEYRISIEASPFGLIRYQERADVRRCDSRPAYLFPQGFDYRRRQFRNIASPLAIPTGAPTIRATSTAPGQTRAAIAGSGASPIATVPAVAFRSQSASAQAYADHAGLLAPPRELDDGDPSTVWREHTGGNGRGLFITLTSPSDNPEIAALRFTPGDGSSRRAFADHNRLRRLGLVIGTEHAFWIDIPTDPLGAGEPRAPLYATLPQGIRGRCVTVVVADVYPGRAARTRRSGETAISDLAVITDLDLAQGGPESVLVQRVIAGGAAGDSAARMLQSRGQGAATAIVSALDSTGQGGDIPPAAALRLRRVLARLGHAVAASQLASGLAATELSKSDRRDFSAALLRMGEPAIAALSAALRDPNGDAKGRVANAQVLASMPDDRARDALIAACGEGDRALRKAVAVGLGTRSVSDLQALLEAIDDAATRGARGREADLWRAVGLMARRAPAQQLSTAGSRLAARLSAGPQGGGADDYELSYRLLDAAGSLATDDTVGAVAKTLSQLASQDDAHSRGLRRVAAAALARNRHERVHPVLIGLANDSDPGVRMEAVSALGPRADADVNSDRALVHNLASDRWPRVRRLAANALSHRCGQVAEARTALDAAIDRDASIDVQREALTSLVGCRAPAVGARLIAVASDRKRAEKLRSHAISLVPNLGDPALVKPLIDLFRTLRERAWSEAIAVRLASAAAVAMGRTGSDQVVAPLMRAAREASFPEIQAAAITGLGEMCPPKARKLFVTLLGSDQRAVLVAARAAHNQCKRGAR